VSESAGMAEARPLDVATLLRIDVEAEVDKVLRGQMLGAWQLPAELVRLAARRAATRVEVQLSAQAVRVTWDGSAPSVDALRSLSQLLVPGAAPDQRHRALLRLEAEGDPALLLLAALKPPQLTIEPQGGQPGLTCRLGVARSAVTTAATPSSTIGVQLALGGDRARGHLLDAVRFAKLEILLNGRRIAPQGSRGMVDVELADGVAGRLWLSERDARARHFLLVDQVVAAELTTAGTPACEAWLELRPALGSTWSAASLRQIGESHIDDLSARAFALLLRLGREMAALSAVQQQRVRRQLLLVARDRHDVRTLMDLPLWRTSAQGQEQPRWRTLGELVARQSRLYALYPGQRAGDFLLPDAEAVVVDADERALLTSVLGLTFVSPQPRLAQARGLRARLGAGLHGLLAGLRSPLRGRRLPETAMGAEERRFVAILRERLGGHVSAVHLTTGRGQVERYGRPHPVLLLPRANPDVVLCRKALLADPAWLYPVALVLLGSSPAGIEQRPAWLQRQVEV
jgi:hypothetical protein